MGRREKRRFRAPLCGQSARTAAWTRSGPGPSQVDVIAAAGTLAPLAAKQASSTIPIVMTAAGDPLRSGLVASLARLEGNVTGMSLMAPDLGGKRLELLKEVLPGSLAWQVGPGLPNSARNEMGFRLR